MYFPHLFARRAELLALRDVSAELPIAATIAPVLEPVKADFRDLVRCLEIMGEAEIRVTVIINPNLGDFKDSAAIPAWRQSLSQSFDTYPSLLPGFVCRSSTPISAVSLFFSQFPNRAVSLLYWSPNLTDTAIQNLSSNNDIAFHINLHTQMSAAQRSLLPVSKSVDINDHFNHLPRNRDYVGKEFFSDDHLNFSTTAMGFGDYSIVGFRFTEGGGPAHAVAIHGIYRSATGALWVEHFVSDDVDAQVGSVEEKYLQAATKLVEEVNSRPGEFGSDAALVAFEADVDNEVFPGLAMSKRRQIHHHLALNHAIISGVL